MQPQLLLSLPCCESNDSRELVDLRSYHWRKMNSISIATALHIPVHWAETVTFYARKVVR